MKINQFQLEAQLSKQLANIYFLSGDDLFLMQDAKEAIIQAAKKNGFNEISRIRVDNNTAWEEVVNECYAISLFAEKRLLEFNFHEALPNKAAAKVLLDYVNAPPSETLLLIMTAKLDSKTMKSEWYQAIDKNAITVPIWPITIQQLPAWLINRAKRIQINLNLEAAQFLAEFTEGNLSAAMQMLEKLALLQPGATLNSAHVKQIISNESRFTIFDFTDSLIAGDAKRALFILTSLQDEGMEPILLLWSLTRELRLMAEMAAALDQGAALPSLWQKYKIFPKKQAACQRFLRRYNQRDCWQFLGAIAKIDSIIKGVIAANPWESMELLALSVCNGKTS